MTSSTQAATSFQPAHSAYSFKRMGYGAMQLAGPHVWGPPRDRDAAMAVLREVVAQNVDHIDTSDFYGPHVTNQLISETLYPYPATLKIVTKIGFRRGEDQSWIPAPSPEELRAAVYDNLRNLRLDKLAVVNLRAQGLAGPEGESIEKGMETLVRLKEEGLIEHIGLSNVNAQQIEQAHAIGDVVCVQKHYNLVHREDDALIDHLATQGIAYVPFFPLGGFTPLQSDKLDGIATRLGTTPMSVALAWLLHRSPNILLIPGTSSVAHLRANLAAADLALDADTMRELNAL